MVCNRERQKHRGSDSGESNFRQKLQALVTHYQNPNIYTPEESSQ